MLPVDLNLLLNEELRALKEKIQDLDKEFPERTNAILTKWSTGLMILCLHAQSISQHYYDGVEYVEDLIRQQLIGAIGKELSSEDFTKYMDYHNKKLFKAEFRMVPFSYSVRFEDRAPEGY